MTPFTAVFQYCGIGRDDCTAVFSPVPSGGIGGVNCSLLYSISKTIFIIRYQVNLTTLYISKMLFKSANQITFFETIEVFENRDLETL